MRIVSVIDGLGFGGAERSLAELLPGLVAAGIDPTVVCLYQREGGIEGEVLAQGHDVRFLPGGTASRIRGLRRVIYELSPHLIHTTLARSSLTGRIAAAGTGVPVLTSLVSQSYTRARRGDPHVNPVALQVVRGVDRLTARHLTTHFHAITNAVKQWAIESLGISDQRISVVERGRDTKRLGVASPDRRARARAMLQLPSDADVIVAVGRHEFAKGHRFLLEAMAAVRAVHPRAILLLAGRGGAETEHLRRVVERRALDGVVQFLGHRHDVPDILAASNVFVLPSLWEGLAGSLIEAMALELPIVASDLQPIREVVEGGRCALLVPSRAPEALASSVSFLLKDRSHGQELGRHGREIFLRRFTLERSTARMVALFRRVAIEYQQGRAVGAKIGPT